MATPVVLTTGARPITPVESGGVPMTPVDTLGEPVTVVDTLGEPVVLINEDGTPAFLAYSAKTYLGGVAPYHWLDFINNRALYASVDVGNVTQATGYSFTRASQGYYTNSDGTLTNFASGALRRGDRGVLIEGSRTNLQTRSNDFTNGTWTPISLAVATSAVAGPDPAATIFSLTATVAGNRLQTDVTVVTATTHTVTYYVAQGTGRYAGIVVPIGGSAGAIYDLQTGVVVSTTGTLVGTGIEAGPTINGTKLWRIRLTITSTGTTLRHGVGVSDGSTYGSGIYPSASSGVIYAGFAQLEPGSFPSSYIPTVAASATRAADVLTYTAGVTYGLSLWAEFERAVDTGGTESLVMLTDAPTYAAYLASFVDSSDLFTSNTAGGTTASSSVTGAIAVGSTTKAAVRALTNDFRTVKNGTLGSNDTSFSYPTTPLKIELGSIVSVNFLFGYIRRAAIFNSALTDAQLQTTTS